MVDRIFFVSVLLVVYALCPLLLLGLKWTSVDLGHHASVKLAVVLVPLVVVLAFESTFRIWMDIGMFAGFALMVPVFLLGLTSAVALLCLQHYAALPEYLNNRDQLALLGPWIGATAMLTLVGVLLWRWWPYSSPRLF